MLVILFFSVESRIMDAVQLTDLQHCLQQQPNTAREIRRDCINSTVKSLTVDTFLWSSQYTVYQCTMEADSCIHV